MGDLIRAKNWSATRIGSVDTWSPALRMMVRFLLANRFPLLLWWGPEYVSIYNDPVCVMSAVVSYLVRENEAS